eukprot:3060601-Pleurochrysis_carterae.AAC.1
MDGRDLVRRLEVNTALLKLIVGHWKQVPDGEKFFGEVDTSLQASSITGPILICYLAAQYAHILFIYAERIRDDSEEKAESVSVQCLTD